MTVDEAMHKIDELERLLDHWRGEPSDEDIKERLTEWDLINIKNLVIDELKRLHNLEVKE